MPGRFVFWFDEGQQAVAQFGREAAATARDEHEFVVQRCHAPGFACGRLKGLECVLFDFGQALLFDAAEIFDRAAKKQFLDALQRQALRLKEADGDELEAVFFGKALATAKQGRVEQAEGAIIANVAHGNALARLTAGGRNAMLVAPIINDLGEFFDGERNVHGGIMTVNSVTVNKKKFAVEKEPRKTGFLCQNSFLVRSELRLRETSRS